MESLKTIYPKSFRNDFKLSNSLIQNSSIINNIDKNPQRKKPIILEIQRIELPKSIEQINKLERILTQLEQNCNATVAEKYLNGFLENEGANSFNEFISKLK